MRYILYARKSSESEDRQVQSIGDQLRALHDGAEKLGITVAMELTESRSAKDPETRPVFAEMLKRIERGEADGIYCWNINRLSRNPIDSGRLSWMLQKGTLKCIRTIDREYRPEDNVLLMAVESGVANQYILDLRKAVIRGMEGKAARGWHPCKPPQGYVVNSETKEIEPGQPQFDLLRRAWDLLLTGSYTVPEIRRQLLRWGYSARRSGKRPRKIFSESHLYRIFDNPFYCGVFTFRRQTYIGKHIPMVSRDEFEKCQRIIHGEVQVRPEKHEFAFTGLIRCKKCGCQVTAERKMKHYKGTQRTAIYEYYHCTRRRGPCSEPAVPASLIEDSISAVLESVSIHPAFGRWLQEVIDRDLNGQVQKEHQIEAQQDATTNETMAKIGRLIELRVSGEITSSEFSQLRGKLQQELLSHRTEAENLHRRHQALRNAIQFGISAKDEFKKGEAKLKRQVAKVLISKCVLGQKRLEIDAHPLLARIAAIEPPKRGAQQNQGGGIPQPVRKEWALREQVRTLLSTVRKLSPGHLSPFLNTAWSEVLPD